MVPVVAGSSPVRHPDSDRADEGPPADHALRPIADALAEAAVGGDEPPGRGELRRKLDAVGAGTLVRTVRGHGYLASDDRLDEVMSPG